MGQDFTYEGAVGDFTVVKSQPANNFAGQAESNLVRFTVTDDAYLLNTTKMIRAVLCDAIQQWIDDERSDLDANGDAAVKGAEEFVGSGDGFSAFRFKFGDKAAEVALSALTNISSTGNITVEKPFADTV